MIPCLYAYLRYYPVLCYFLPMPKSWKKAYLGNFGMQEPCCCLLLTSQMFSDLFLAPLACWIFDHNPWSASGQCIVCELAESVDFKIQNSLCILCCLPMVNIIQVTMPCHDFEAIVNLYLMKLSHIPFVRI